MSTATDRRGLGRGLGELFQRTELPEGGSMGDVVPVEVPECGGWGFSWGM